MNNQTDSEKLNDTPIGINTDGLRHETDSMGAIDVPADHYWGAQTQGSLVHFSIGDDRMPKRVHHAYGYVKTAAALVNAAADRLPQWKTDAIVPVRSDGDGMHPGDRRGQRRRLRRQPGQFRV
jgi:fumarate hydratase class II